MTKQTTTHNTLEELPLPLLAHCMNNLTICNLLKVFSTCTKFYDLQDNRVFWKHLCFCIASRSPYPAWCKCTNSDAKLVNYWRNGYLRLRRVTADDVVPFLLKYRYSDSISHTTPSSDYDHHIKIVMLGDPAVGKESIATRFLRNVFLKDKSHVGVAYGQRTMYHSCGARLFVQVWFGNTIKAHTDLFDLDTHVMRDAHVILACYDITNEQSMVHLEKWIRAYRDNVCSGDSQDMHLAPLVVCAAKSDMEAKRKIDKKKGQEFAARNDAYAFFETSAKTGYNVELMFEDILTPASRSVFRKYVSDQIAGTHTSENRWGGASPPELLDPTKPTSLVCGIDQTLLCPIL